MSGANRWLDALTEAPDVGGKRLVSDLSFSDGRSVAAVWPMATGDQCLALCHDSPHDFSWSCTLPKGHAGAVHVAHIPNGVAVALWRAV